MKDPQNKNSAKSKKIYPHAEHRKRLRERYLRAGLKGLQDYELVELLLTYTIPFQDVKPLAKKLLERFKTVGGVLDADPQELQQFDGIKENGIAFFQIIRDVARTTLYETLKSKDSVTFKNSKHVREYLIREIGHQPKETFFVFFLDNQNRLLGSEPVQQGTINQTAVYPREIFEKALQLRATALIFAHNHPSGTLNPSPEDIRLNEKLSEAAKLLQMTVLDHLIVSSEGHFSFHEAGLI